MCIYIIYIYNVFLYINSPIDSVFPQSSEYYSPLP